MVWPFLGSSCKFLLPPSPEHSPEHTVPLDGSGGMEDIPHAEVGQETGRNRTLSPLSCSCLEKRDFHKTVTCDHTMLF